MSAFWAFDVETTGLPLARRADFKNLEMYDTCRLVSFALIEYDSEHRERSVTYHIVQPEGYTVTATEIHGITHERAVLNGVPFGEVYEDICKKLKEIPVVVGHNLEFDMNVLMSEVWRRGLPMDVIENVRTVCTLRMTRDFFFEFRKLGLLYKDLFGRELDGAHNALADARAAGEVYIRYMQSDPRKYKRLAVDTLYLSVYDIGACLDMCGFKKPLDVQVTHVKPLRHFSVFPICTVHGTTYMMYGRVDHNGIYTKNRIKALFGKVRDYENAQMQAFLHMDPGRASVHLVEHHEHESNDMIVERDDVTWTKMFNKLTEFCKAMHHKISVSV